MFERQRLHVSLDCKSYKKDNGMLSLETGWNLLSFCGFSVSQQVCVSPKTNY